MTNEEMSTDSLWLRSRPQEGWGAQKNYGQFSPYYTATNVNERLEMIYRTLGKANGWEMNKSKLISVRDKANRYRLSRNLVRLVKNPIGYIYWKMLATFRHFKPTRVATLISCTIVSAYMFFKQQAEFQDNSDRVLIRYGKFVEGHHGTAVAATSRALYVFPSFPEIGRQVLTYHNVIANPASKQSIRKELQLLNLYKVNF